MIATPPARLSSGPTVRSGHQPPSRWVITKAASVTSTT